MKFSVPTTWHNDLCSELSKDSVYELYGKLKYDFIGGGRPSFVLPDVSPKEASLHVQQAHRKGIRFNYVINASCMGNIESTIFGHKRLRRFLDWLININVDSVTVAIPYLFEIIKKQYPQLKACISVVTNVNSIEKARYWEGLGADSITLSLFELNRNFNLLRKIRKAVRCDLQLIANAHCLYQCPFSIYHYNCCSHASQKEHFLKGFMVEYCHPRCYYQRIKYPVNFIRSGWIRPEDMRHYEDVGINRLKLVDRGMSTRGILSIVNAYTKGYYDGNLLDLLFTPQKQVSSQGSGYFRKIKHFFRPSLINIFRLARARKIFAGLKVYIDNRALDGFLEHFLNSDCSLVSCQECGYCLSVAKKVVKIDPCVRQELLDNISTYLEDITSGNLFKYI